MTVEERFQVWRAVVRRSQEAAAEIERLRRIEAAATGGRGEARRGSIVSAVRRPCASCPWRVDQHADAIPNFSLKLAEGLSRTCPMRGYGPDFGSPQFACHQSREGEEIVCAGWLATNGGAHPAVRMGVLSGHVPAEALSPGDDWPELHEIFEEVIGKLRADCAGLGASA